jgi:hypothetical protein
MQKRLQSIDFQVVIFFLKYMQFRQSFAYFFKIL